MQKVKQDVGEHLPPLKIYREDIEDIYAILNEVSNKIIIEADGFTFESIDELFTYKKIQINSLKMSLIDPYVSIDFEPNKIWLYSSDNTSMQVGLYAKIKSIVIKRKNWAFRLITNPTLIGLWGGITIQPFIFYIKTNELQYSIASILGFVTALFWWLYASKIMFKKHSQIFLVYKKNTDLPFLKRNKDSLIITLIAIVVSGFISYLLK